MLVFVAVVVSPDCGYPVNGAIAGQHNTLFSILVVSL